MIDLHSRHVIGWAVSNRLKRDLALEALDRAVALRNLPPGVHSAHGQGWPILRARLSKAIAGIGLPSVHEWQRQLLRQCRRRDLLQNTES